MHQPGNGETWGICLREGDECKVCDQHRPQAGLQHFSAMGRHCGGQRQDDPCLCGLPHAAHHAEVATELPIKQPRICEGA